jgi:hypothetical protein
LKGPFWLPFIFCPHYVFIFFIIECLIKTFVIRIIISRAPGLLVQLFCNLQAEIQLKNYGFPTSWHIGSRYTLVYFVTCFLLTTICKEKIYLFFKLCSFNHVVFFLLTHRLLCCIICTAKCWKEWT